MNLIHNPSIVNYQAGQSKLLLNFLTTLSFLLTLNDTSSFLLHGRQSGFDKIMGNFLFTLTALAIISAVLTLWRPMKTARQTKVMNKQ